MTSRKTKGPESRIRDPRIIDVKRRAAKVRPARMHSAVAPAAQGLGSLALAGGPSTVAGAISPATGPMGLPSPRPRRVRDRAALRSDQRRLAELKDKLGDEDYMNGAILTIATVLSARLTLR